MPAPYSPRPVARAAHRRSLCGAARMKPGAYKAGGLFLAPRKLPKRVTSGWFLFARPVSGCGF